MVLSTAYNFLYSFVVEGYLFEHGCHKETTWISCALNISAYEFPLLTAMR